MTHTHTRSLSLYLSLLFLLSLSVLVGAWGLLQHVFVGFNVPRETKFEAQNEGEITVSAQMAKDD